MVFPYIYSFFSSSPATAHRAQQEKNSSETDSGSNCDKVSLHMLSQVWYLSFAFYGDLMGGSFRQGNGQLQNGDSNSRHASLSEEEENLAVLRRWVTSPRSFICNQITRQMDCEKLWSTASYLLSPGRNHWFDLSLCLYSLSVCRHVMNELLETERAYVEELLCVLQVGINSLKMVILLCGKNFMGFFSRCVFRDMPLRWTIQQWFPSCLLLCRTKRRFCLATCQKSTTSTGGEGAPSACHWWYQHTVICHVVSLTGALLMEKTWCSSLSHRLPCMLDN